MEKVLILNPHTTKLFLVLQFDSRMIEINIIFICTVIDFQMQAATLIHVLLYNLVLNVIIMQIFMLISVENIRNKNSRRIVLQKIYL